MELPVTYCSCGRSFDVEQFMIQCDICKQWYHGGCVGMKEYMAMDIDKYHCPTCETTCGASMMKIHLNEHRHDYSDPQAESKPVQTGTPVFMRELKSRHFLKPDEVVKYVRGQQLTMQYLQSNGFMFPLIIDSKEGLDMTIPPPNFSVYDVESYIGGDREMDVIDVTKQSNVRMKLREFVEYYNSLDRTKIFNVISLEFSNTGLSPMVEAPYIARKLDWVNTVWPTDWPEGNETMKRPEVQKYCLMGVKDSFTDFHIDFGGTSVWYHVLRGEKIFYLIKPTPNNIQLYQQWMSSTTQSETFFGDQADACYKCVIKQGQTMMIPTGWIHAVLTPVDSLVFGGNFLHSLNIPMQIQIYELEKKMKTPMKYQYPGFETINWFAAKKLLKELKDLNNERKKCPACFLQGTKALLVILKQWNTDKDYNMTSRGHIPGTINSGKLLKDLSKEIRHAERYLMALNPPKPERESQRKKKKPLNKDFIDYDNLTDDLLLNKKKLNNDSRNRPPLKMTLPKPITYPSLPPPPPNSRLAETTSNKKKTNKTKKKIHDNSSSTVIRFKLGDNEVVRRSTSTASKDFQNELAWKKTSVYDFHDGSNESDYDKFTIDESPKRKNRKLSNHQKKKLKSNIDNRNNNDDVIPKNGIEELIKASVYTLDSTSVASATQVQRAVPTVPGSGRASPSTREAIAGMLSFSEQCYSTDTTTMTTTSGSKSTSTNKSKFKVEEEEDDELSIENIEKVHQDDDFIYPALDASDDEDFIFKPKSKDQIDEAWNPKARVGPLLPKTNRPAREGVRKTSVEKGLEAAAAKRDKQLNSTKRSYKKKKQKLVPLIESVKRTIPMEEISPTKSICTYNSILTIPNRLNDVKAKLAASVSAERKPKKGMKTAKQRLGKILKLHKMMH